MKFDDVVRNIENWFKHHGLDNPEFIQGQMMKLVEENGELASSIIRKDKDGVANSIADSVVVLIGLALQHGMDMVEILNEVYEEISQRSGKVVDGVLIKDEDLDEME